VQIYQNSQANEISDNIDLEDEENYEQVNYSHFSQGYRQNPSRTQSHLRRHNTLRSSAKIEGIKSNQSMSMFEQIENILYKM
jgi:hypothetical protein